MPRNNLTSVLVILLYSLLGVNCMEAASNETKAAKQRSYDGYSVLRLTPTTSDQLTFLKKLSVSDPKLDFWTRPTSLNETVDVMVPPLDLLRLEKLLRKLNIDKLLMIDDVERVVKKERQTLEETEKLNQDEELELLYRSPSNFFPFPNSPSFSHHLSFSPSSVPPFFDKYQRIDSIYDFIDNLAKSYPGIASTIKIGKSYESRELKIIKISGNKTDRTGRSAKKPAIYVDAGLHAREWISVSTALYLAHVLTNDYDIDPDVQKIVDTYDIYIHPVANPDGYEWTHTRDRLWRKTRSRNGLSLFGCRGVDPNRNFDFHWNEVGASDSPCADVFAGPKAFSEPETRSIADFILDKKDQIKLFIALHSYSQLWLTPWGFTGKLPENYSQLESKGRSAASALAKRYGTKYRVGSATNVLYAAAGGADDWAYGVAKIPFVYTVELRDTGKHGFILPKDQIIPSGEEFVDGFKHLALDINE